MSKNRRNIMGAIKNKAMEIAIKQAIQKIKEDPDKNLPKLLEIVEKVDKDNMWEQQYKFIEKVVKDPSNNWNHYIRNILEDIDEEILEKFLCNFIINSAIKGISRNHEIKEKEGCGHRRRPRRNGDGPRRRPARA